MEDQMLFASALTTRREVVEAGQELADQISSTATRPAWPCSGLGSVPKL